VLNYHLPFDTDGYVHRVGRTGRAGNKGVAITLVTPQEYKALARIQKATGSDISYRRVPTLTEANENLAGVILNRVKNAKISDFSKTIVNALCSEFNIRDTALMLASVLWNNEGFSGPETLGVTGKKLDRLRNPLKEKSEFKNRRTSGIPSSKFKNKRFVFRKSRKRI
jgi:ATP-dependent RNA helicase DeaD